MGRPISGTRKTVTAILLEAGVVTDEQIEAGLLRQRETGQRIGETLVALGYVSEEDIGWALARQLGITFVDVRVDALDAELAHAFPEAVLRRLQMVPLVHADGVFTFAAADPTDLDSLVELERLSGDPGQFVASTPTAIARALDALFGARPAARPRPVANNGTRFDVLWDRSGEEFLQFHVLHARRAGATEVHFVTVGDRLQVLHRIGARLRPAAEEPAGVVDVLLARLASDGLQGEAGRESHHSGSLVCKVEGREQPLHVSLLVARDGPSITLRLLRDPDERPRLDSLGIDPVDVARLRGLVSEPGGLVLVCGPTGSGCSTTLATLLAELPTEERRWLVFARDQRRWPAVPGLVDVVTGTPLRSWRRVAVAHGADGLVLDGGLDGRRVRAVLGSATHARWVLARTDWEDTFSLLEWLGRTPDGRALIARRLRAVIQQRLVAGAGAEGARAPRRGLFEVLFASEPLRAALGRGADASQLRAAAEPDGFRPLADRVRAGLAAGELDPQDAARAVA